MKMISVYDSVGCILSHDVTQIIPEEFKGRLFKKGHIIKEEDIEKLLSIGKEHIYVWEPSEGELHENDAAIRISNLVLGDGACKSEEIKPKKCLLITTGNEVYSGRIKDAFLPVIKSKLGYYGSEVINQVILPDSKERIIEEIKNGLSENVDMIICTGGMSVDPDDVTPTAIKECGGELVTYGSPVLPGAMFLLAYYKDIPILGVPSCAMYSKRTVLDLVLPRILADEKLTLGDIADYGHGGLCLDCKVCTFPHCSFGK